MKSFLKKLFILLVFTSYNVIAQDNLAKEIEVILLTENTTITQEQKLEQLVRLLLKQKKIAKTPEIGTLYAEIGKLYYKTNNNEKAILNLKKAIQIQERYKKEGLEALNKTRNNLAWIYSYEERDYERYQVLNQIINDQGHDKYTFNAIIDIAVLEAKKGDFYAGLQRLNVVLANTISLDQEIKIRMVIIGIYGKMYENVFAPRKQADFKVIKNHQLKMEEGFEKTTLEYDDLYTAYNNLANVYEAFNDNETALKLYVKVKDFYSNNKDTTKQLSALNNMGYLYSKQGKEKQAISCYQEVIQKANAIDQIATAYDNMGYFLNTNSILKKIPYFEKAIQTVLERKETSFTIPSLEIIRASGYQQDVLIYLVDLAYHYVKAYKENANKIYLLKAKETLYRIDELVSLMRYESNSEQSKLFWIEKGVNTYMLAVEVCYLLNQPDEAFYFMEKNKALLLQENIKMLQAKLELEIPKKIQEKEYKLHYELVALDKQFQQNTNNALLKEKYLQKSNIFQKFMDSLQKQYPDYVKIKKEVETISLNKAITTTINNTNCFVTYIFNEDDGYGLFCSAKEKIFFKITEVKTFQKKLLVLKQYMQQQRLNKEQITKYRKIGYEVFTTLFPFKNAVAKLTNKKISIIPDDTLINVPFEALPITKAGTLSDSYLIHIAEVSYLQSFSLSEKIKENKNNPRNKLLAIAPHQFENKQLQELALSKEAMNALSSYNSTMIFVGEQATKENFYKYSMDYEIIHLNTHAGVDSITKTPWISFRNNKLTLDELYGMNNQADLVILDACKTNVGDFASGEGIINLSRGFFYNGSKSVLASLWNVNEKAGNEILATFYLELEQGKSKSKALQLAKIKYLKEHQFSEVLPYYWASFTLTGNTNPIAIVKKKPYAKTVLLGFIIILFLSLLWKNRKRFFKKA